MAFASMAATDPAEAETLFRTVRRELGTPTLVVPNIDGRVAGVFRKTVIELEPEMVRETVTNAAFSAFLVGQQAALGMIENQPGKRLAAFAFRRGWTKMSSTLPSASMARHSQYFMPRIVIMTSSTCHLSRGAGRSRRTQSAKAARND
jgi:hypothetical protein